MPFFTYKAVDKTGRESSGRLSADSRAAAIDQVAALGLQPVSLDEAGADKGADLHPAHARRISRASVQAFTRELANLLGGGVPLSRALMLLCREAADAGRAASGRPSTRTSSAAAPWRTRWPGGRAPSRRSTSPWCAPARRAASWTRCSSRSPTSRRASGTWSAA